MEENNKTYSRWSIVLLWSFGIIIGLLWVFVGFKCALLFVSIFSFLMYVNISVTGLCNALVGRQLPPANDVFWKLILMLATAIPLSILLII